MRPSPEDEVPRKDVTETATLALSHDAGWLQFGDDCKISTKRQCSGDGIPVTGIGLDIECGTVFDNPKLCRIMERIGSGLGIAYGLLSRYDLLWRIEMQVVLSLNELCIATGYDARLICEQPAILDGATVRVPKQEWSFYLPLDIQRAVLSAVRSFAVVTEV